MAPSPHNTAAVILCRPDGTATEIVYDELALSPGDTLESLFAAPDRGKMHRFLEAVAAEKAVLDWKLKVQTASGTAPLYFSGSTSGRLIVILATRGRFEAGDARPNLKANAVRDTRHLRVGIARLALKKVPVSPGKVRMVSRQRHGLDASSVELLKVLSHDLKNPLSGILAASQFLLEDAGHLLDRHQLTLLQLIESSSELAIQSIEDIVELHSIRSRGLALQLQSTDMAALVAECGASHRQRASNRRVTLEVTKEGAIPMLRVDRRRITQAINALLRNEIESLQPGGRVAVVTAVKGNSVAVVISTQGASREIGGVKTILGKIRGGALKGGLSEARTALVVAAVNRIVEAHRGLVRREGGATGGTTISMQFPVTPS